MINRRNDFNTRLNFNARFMDPRQAINPYGDQPQSAHQNNYYFVNCTLAPKNSTSGGAIEMMAEKRLPDNRFVDLAFNVFNQSEKDELLRELLQAALSSIYTGDTESIRRVLLAWEYTALWKNEPEKIKELSELEEDGTESGVDWREFLASEGA